MTEPPDYTNRYNTPLAPGEKPAFKAWLAQLSKFKKHDAAKEMFDYDLQGAFKAGETPDERGHLDDRFKKPNHTTFSNESIYSTPDNPGGQWLPHRPGRWDYQASPANLKARSPAQLQDYFRQYEPNSRLFLPKEAAMPVGNVDYKGGLGQGPGVGDLAQLAARLFTRGGGGGQPTAPVTPDMLQGAFGIPAAAPRRNYLGGDVAAAQALLRPPPPERVPGVPSAPAPQQAGYIGGGKISGPGDGRSDSVPAMIDGQGMAQLSADEYVVPADVVSALGRGSSAAGAKKLDATVQQVRAGYASKLRGMKGPKAGGGKKGLGGLFQTQQDNKIELPDYLRSIAGALPGSFQNYQKQRPSAVSEIAQFTPDQQAFFERSRQAANDPTGAQAAYQQGQNLLGGIYQGGNPWDDTLIQQSMSDYDRGTQINAAAARRSVAGRGAFGEGSQLAANEAAQEAARGRGLLGSQLREQGLSRRTQAAQEIGNLAGLERQANIGDVNLLGGIGQVEYGRAQQVAQAPFDRMARINSLVQGAPTQNTTTMTESPLKMMIGAAAAGAAAAAKDGGRVRAGGRASHRKRAQKEQLYADGGQVAPGAFKRIPVSKPTPKGVPIPDDWTHLEWKQYPPSKPSFQEQVNATPGLAYEDYHGEPRPMDRQLMTEVGGDVRPRRAGMPTLAPPSGRSFSERVGERQSANVQDKRAYGKAMQRQAGHLYAGVLKGLMSQGLSLPAADRAVSGAMQGVDEQDYATKNARLSELLRGMVEPGLGEAAAPAPGIGATMTARAMPIPTGAGGRGYADGGFIPPSERVPDWRTATSGGTSASAGLGDWFNRYVMSRSDPMASAGKYFLGDAEGLPPPPERTGGSSVLSAAAQRALEVAGPSAPDVAAATPAPTAPIPVSKPARKGGTRKAGPTTVATSAPLLAAPGMGALPARLSSPEDPITAAPPSPPAPGIKVTEIPPPPKANASPEAHQSWFDKWASNPLTQFGLAMMASSPNESVGQAIGRSGLTAIAGAAAGRKESREEQRLAQQDQRLQQADERANRAEVVALKRLGLDEEKAQSVVADRAEQRRIANARLGIEQTRADADARYKAARLGQLNEGLGIRRQALAKVGAGKAAADPNKALRDRLMSKLGDAIDGGDTEHATELRQAIASLGPVPAEAAAPLPEGFALDDGEP